jgi:tetratricopeptide (TPR) repeat protein
MLRGDRPLAELIAREMAGQSLSLSRLAELIQSAARSRGEYSRATPQLVSKWRNGSVTPGPHHVRLLAEALGLPIEVVAAVSETQRNQAAASLSGSAVPFLERPAEDPANPDYIRFVRDFSQRLVVVDSLLGGDDAAALAMRLFHFVQKRLAHDFFQRAVERELQAATAELAEVTGWLLFDADHQEAARQLNHEALSLARLAGDRPIELLTLQNLSLQAHWRGRPAESLQMARALSDLVAAGRSARVRALIHTREARALAQMGRRRDALGAFERARQQFYDGADGADPPWAWWIDIAEFNYHEGQMRADLRDWGPATDHLARAVEACPANRPRDHVLYRAYLLEALVHSGAEEDTVALIEALIPSMGGIGSSRTAAVIHRAARPLLSGKAGPRALSAALELESRPFDQPPVA